MSDHAPLRIPRLALLLLCWAFGVVGASISLNALINFNRERSRIHNLAPDGVVIHIDIHDIFSIGGVLAGGCALLAILSALYLFCTFFRVRDNYTFLQVQAWSTYFCAIWLLATLIPFDLLFATGEAVVSASLNGISLSQNVIKDAEGALGISPLYRSRSYLRLLAVIPWFAFLLAVITGVTLSLTAHRILASNDHAKRHGS